MRKYRIVDGLIHKEDLVIGTHMACNMLNEFESDKEALIQEMNNLDLLLPGDGFEVYVKLSDVEKIIRGVK